MTTSITKFFKVIASLPAKTVAKIWLSILESLNYKEWKYTIIKAHKRMKSELLDKLMLMTTITGQLTRTAIHS